MTTRHHVAPGMLDPMVLDQDKEWRDATGQVTPLEELDSNHLANLIPFLQRHGEMLRWHWGLAQIRIHHAQGRDAFTGELKFLWSDNGGNLDDAFDSWLSFEQERPLNDWLDNRPLVRRIRRMLEDRT